MATYVIGDIHGCLVELTRLLLQLQLKPADIVVFVGDLVDKGPDSAGVVKLVKELSTKQTVLRVMGNHESKHMRYRKHVNRLAVEPKYIIPMKPGEEFLATYKAIGSDIDWLTHSIPLSVEVNGMLVTHGGIEPCVGKVNDRSMFMRTCTPDGKFLSLNDAKKRPDAVPWYTLYKGPQKVIYGHIATDAPVVSEFAIGIDTGCVHGGFLTAIKLDNMDIIQVKADKQYAPPFEE